MVSVSLVVLQRFVCATFEETSMLEIFLMVTLFGGMAWFITHTIEDARGE